MTLNRPVGILLVSRPSVDYSSSFAWMIVFSLDLLFVSYVLVFKVTDLISMLQLAESLFSFA